MLTNEFRPQLEALGDRVVPAAHFLYANSSISADGDLTVNFKEAGLGNKLEEIPLTLEGTVSATFQWFNHGGNRPQGQPFVIEPVAFSITETFPVRNGHVTGTFTVDAPAPPQEALDHEHAKNWVLRGTVSYTDVAVFDAENNVSTAPDFDLDQSASFVVDVG